jgi:hypothetical protein
MSEDKNSVLLENIFKYSENNTNDNESICGKPL